MDKLNKAHDDGVVLGLADVAGVAQRLDIDVMLLKQPDTFNLFIIALLELQGRQVPWKVDPGYTFTSADKISFFQLAGALAIHAARARQRPSRVLTLRPSGIHGLPHEDWDGVAKPPLPQGDKASEKPFKDGYCAHATPAFPCWHRPYLALLEVEQHT